MAIEKFLKNKKNIAIVIAAAVLILAAAGMFAAGKQKKIQVGALCYHKFHTQEELTNGLEPSEYSIPVEEFEYHLQYLKENGIRVITASELLAFIDGEIDLPEKCMLLTVDDCSISFYQYAYPLLQEYGMTINAAVIGNRSDWAVEGSEWREQYSSWEELQEMAASGVVEFGSHTYYLHDKTDGRTGTMIKSDERLETYRETLINDLTPLNQKLEEKFGYRPRFFVYPFYAVSMPSIPTLTEELGYELLFCGNSDSTYRYFGEYVHTTNYNAFIQGAEPESRIIKRFTPRTGDDFDAMIETIFETA